MLYYELEYEGDLLDLEFQFGPEGMFKWNLFIKVENLWFGSEAYLKINHDSGNKM